MSNGTVTNQGPSVLSILGISFIILKLTGVIDWSWWWVTAPFWGPLALVIGLATMALIVVGVIGIFGIIASIIYDWKDY